MTLIALIAYFIKFDVELRFDMFFVLVLSGCFVFQLVKIFPFTPLADYEVLPPEASDENRMLSLYTANVYQENKKPEALLSEIKRYDPDIIVLTETNKRWTAVLQKNLKSAYAYQVSIPLENTYGMLVGSKYPLYGSEVKYIVDDSIPSIHTKIILPKQDTIQLFAIHPRPPLPGHNLKSTGRDAELMEIAKLSRASNYSVIVTGDFNDVAWSGTTGLFHNMSGLLDMRKGLGFYNTYHAKYPIFRWPLDHIFISPEFRNVALELGGKIHSDHIPMYVKLSFEPEGKEKHRVPLPTQEETERANEMVRKGKLAN
ncbi:endonuclease/exonuclease/phosphatase family protein [Ulvibacterium marinum]|uniref:Endonuclease/exonuclease/phosphatase family protein n=2 Tax=Ulvibacterium marinum TaxID=2419782 RepID=A0A3B0CH87_9FLAO|nr:endonuclease/exonuclease/phosphatase family protein [Ulvibacterium marinum]